MEKSQLPSLPQLAKIAAFLLFLLTYLFNALVIALSVEAGFLTAISDHCDDMKPPPSTASRNMQLKPSDDHAAVANAHLVGSTTNNPTNATTTLPNSSINMYADPCWNVILAKKIPCMMLQPYVSSRFSRAARRSRHFSSRRHALLVCARGRSTRWRRPARRRGSSSCCRACNSVRCAHMSHPAAATHVRRGRSISSAAV
uniref:Uncharacterized protein n=1 Tax=Arundo donax TaxID=35708 RepID=A0A0A9E7K3_ARUDO